jgi:Fe-S-cluster containining protein
MTSSGSDVEFGVVQTCHAEMDRQWQLLLDQNAQRTEPIEVACRLGCAACCTQLPDASYSEGGQIADAIEHAPAPLRAEALDRLFAWEAEYLRWVGDDHMPLPSEDWKAHLFWRSRWHLRRIACPFLNIEDHTCGVYPMRPSPCRAHHAARSPDTDELQPPERCFPDAALAQGFLPSIGQLTRVNLSGVYSQHLQDALEAEGIEYRVFILPLVVMELGRAHYGWAPDGPPGPVRVLKGALAVA